MAEHINHHAAYRAVDRDDFASMIEVERYGTRSDAFDEIVNIRRPNGEIVTGSVLDVSRDWAMVQCFGDTHSLFHYHTAGNAVRRVQLPEIDRYR